MVKLPHSFPHFLFWIPVIYYWLIQNRIKCALNSFSPPFKSIQIKHNLIIDILISQASDMHSPKKSKKGGK